MKITGFWKHLFSRLLGSKDQYRAKRCASTTIWLSMIAGIICAVISVIFLEKIALSMGADTNTLPSVKRYMLFYGIGAPFIVANFTLEQMIRGEGESMLKEIFSVGFSAMILAVIMSVVRGLILIPVIIVGNWLFQLNGVIFSLLVSEAVSCITGCVIYYLIRNK